MPSSGSPPPSPSHLEAKLTALEQIYAYYGELSGVSDWACKGGCAACCTCNVSLTTLEGVYLYRAISPLDLKLLLGLQTRAQKPRYQPEIALNEFARRCAQGHPIPEEPNDPQWGTCPLLVQDFCSFYAQRPFGCRCMLSTQRCDRHGQAADLDEFQLTLNHLFLQVIEHLDCPGWTGNLTDILLYLHHSESHHTGSPDEATAPQPAFPANQPAKVLMIPPEHRQAAGPIVGKLQRIISLS